MHEHCRLLIANHANHHTISVESQLRLIVRVLHLIDDALWLSVYLGFCARWQSSALNDLINDWSQVA